MSNSITNRPIIDNSLLIGENEYIGIEVQKVIVGIENSNEREILLDKATGYNYSRNLVEPQEIYNYSKKRHSCCFMLDLETGQHG
jgi:hypothetical protein